MKPIIPFLLLGSIGAVGVIKGVDNTDGGATPTTSTPGVGVTTAGPIEVKAAFEHSTLPAQQAGDTFVKVSITGLEQAQQAQAQRPPVNLTLVIDRSGSMRGERKMEAAEEAACAAIKALEDGDTFAVISFDNGAERVAQGVAPSAVSAACTAIDALSARGGTDMAAGLDVGGAAARSLMAPGRVNRMLLLSDGQPDNEQGLAARTAALASEGITTTTIGLGTNYNEDLMAKIADAGLGNSYFVESRPERRTPESTNLAGIFQTELKSMAEVVAKRTYLQLQPLAGLTITEVIGFPFDKNGTAVVVPVGDIYAKHTTDILVRVHHVAATGEQHLLDVRVEGADARTDVAFGNTLALNAAFSADAAVVAAALVPEVAEEAEQFRTTQALLVANEAYNRGDFKGGDKILNEQKAVVRRAAKSLSSTKLEALFDDVDSYQEQNASFGAAGRGSMNKLAKEKARDLNRSAKK